MVLAAGRPEASQGESWRYRAHLDGLRGLAVMLVLLFHADIAEFEGGFVGVDVFFVLSGFVVTGVILRDLQQDRFSATRFYERRIRRLMPAALTTILVVVGLWSVMATPLEQANAGRDAASASLYVSNWRFTVEATDYFGSAIEQSPVLHFWSLSVEEQFYLLWPLLAVVAYRMARRRMGPLAGALALMAIAAAAWALFLSEQNILRAYYGADTRAYQLLAGASIGTLAFGDPRHRILRPGHRLGSASAPALVALLALSTSVAQLNPIHRGVAVTAATVVLIASLDANSDTWVKRVLSHRVSLYLGRRSYALYLWHWPINLLIAGAWDLNPWERFGIVAVLAVVTSELSFWLIETPVRSRRVGSGLRPRSVVAIGLLASAAVAGISLAALSASGEEGAADWQGAAEDARRANKCVLEDPATCLLIASVSGDAVLILGDSHMAQWAPAFEGAARTTGYELWESTKGGCPPAVVIVVDENGKDDAVCEAFISRSIDLVARERIPIVVLGGLYRNSVRDGEVVLGDGPGDERQAHLQEGMVRLIERLGDVGVEMVVIIEPIPRSPFNVPDCLSVADTPAACDFDAVVDSAGMKRWLRGIPAEVNGVDVVVLDLDDVVCPAIPRCQAVANGYVTRRDRGHMTASYSETLSPDIAVRIFSVIALSDD